MNNKLCIKLYLDEQSTISRLTRRVYEDELKKINSKVPLVENQVDINKTYMIREKNKLEVGFFIRNGLNKNISFEYVPLMIEDTKGNVIASEVFNFKGNGVIPPYSAKPFSVFLELKEGCKFNEKEKYTIKISNFDELNVFGSTKTEIENMPDNLTFEQEKEIDDYVKSLNTLSASEFNISLYKFFYNENRGIQCTLLLRNGTNSEAVLEKLPLRILDEKSKIVAYKVFTGKEELIKVNPKKSIFMDLYFEPFEVLEKSCDLSKCRVIFE